ncbi:hypothetical protein JTB14_024161 [Gonioctena quinquepunctata]|nr:hypothetical protein JTB14_024161 [Gonioctena quinquepunctata]
MTKRKTLSEREFEESINNSDSDEDFELDDNDDDSGSDFILEDLNDGESDQGEDEVIENEDIVEDEPRRNKSKQTWTIWKDFNFLRRLGEYQTDEKQQFITTKHVLNIPPCTLESVSRNSILYKLSDMLICNTQI